MMFEVKNRAYSDNNISEVAGKFLPLHPTARYKSFPSLWKKTRKVSGYVPRPITCVTKESEFFPCCLSCGATAPESLKELLARRSANVGWLSADWWWDFGWTLPEEFVSFGVGVTPPLPPIERDRVFILDNDFKRKYLLDLEEHASCGGNQHEAKIKITNTFAVVTFPGEIVATATGLILIAHPRTTLFGKGVEIFELYEFKAIEMPYNLPILLDGKDFVQENGKMFFNGIAIN